MGLPTSGVQAGIARFVREDPVRKGLLYAGTETSVWVSFDDGDHWQSLQLNLPASSMRDLTVHGDDLVLATYGRSIYILDDVTPLRQVEPITLPLGAYFTSRPTPCAFAGTTIRTRRCPRGSGRKESAGWRDSRLFFAVRGNGRSLH